MKILVLFPSVPKALGGESSGGDAVVAWHLSREYRQLEHEVDVFTKHSWPRDSVVDGMRVHANPRGTYKVVRLLRSPLSAGDLRIVFLCLMLLERERLKHLINMVAVSAFVRHAVSRGAYDFIHLHGNSIYCYAALIAIRKTRAQKVLLVSSHGLALSERHSRFLFPIEKVELEVFALQWSRAIPVTAVGKRTEDLLRDRPSRAIAAVVTNGVDSTLFGARGGKLRTRS